MTQQPPPPSSRLLLLLPSRLPALALLASSSSIISAGRTDMWTTFGLSTLNWYPAQAVSLGAHFGFQEKEMELTFQLLLIVQQLPKVD